MVQPPIRANMTTNIGKKFIQLIKKHFGETSPLHKILNTSTIKIGYSCTPNMRSIIQKHNRKIINKDNNTTPVVKCNCRKQPCPLDGNCLAECVVYEASITQNDNKTTTYCGSTGGQFKTRYRNHIASFKNMEKSKDTTLATYIWQHKIDPRHIKWRIVGQRKPVTPGGICGICTLEKITIMKNNGPDSLNVRSEIARKCPHRDKNSLARC